MTMATKSPEAIKAMIASLEAELREALAAEQSAAIAAYAALTLTYDYSIEWEHCTRFRIGRELTKQSFNDLAALAVQFPDHKPRAPWTGSASYSLLAENYCECRGGNLVVDFEQFREAGGGYSAPYLLPETIISALKSGIVPDEIKKP